MDNTDNTTNTDSGEGGIPALRHQNFSKAVFLILLFFTFILICCIVKVAATVIMPIVAAVLLSFVLEPLVKRIHSITHINWSLISFLLLLILLISFIALSRLLVRSIMSIASNYGNYEEQVTRMYRSISDMLKIPFDEDVSVYANIWEQFNGRRLLQDFALSLSGRLFTFIKKLLTVLLFSFFLLSEVQYFKDKMRHAFNMEHGKRLQGIIPSIMQQVTSYISIKFLISLATGLLVFLGTLLIGVDFPIIWGFMAFLLNFIPTFGSLVSILGTVAFSVIEFYPNPLPIVLTICLMVGTNGTLGQFIEPRITGDNLGLSPFIILASLTIWGWLWGFMGMILSVPMMVIVKIICENSTYLHPVAVLLGTGRKAAKA